MKNTAIFFVSLEFLCACSSQDEVGRYSVLEHNTLGKEEIWNTSILDTKTGKIYYYNSKGGIQVLDVVGGNSTINRKLHEDTTAVEMTTEATPLDIDENPFEDLGGILEEDSSVIDTRGALEKIRSKDEIKAIRTFKVSDYDASINVEQQDIQSFLEAYPHAQETKVFVFGEDTFDIFLSNVEAFKKAVPNAKELYPTVSSFMGNSLSRILDTANLGNLAPLTKNKYLDLFVKGTQKLAEKHPSWSENTWGIYFNYLAVKKNFSNEDINYIKSTALKKP